MSLDKFARSSVSRSGKRIFVQNNSFPLTKDGDYDFSYHRLCNIKSPEEDNDSTTKVYVDSSLNDIKKELYSEIRSLNESTRSELANEFYQQIQSLHDYCDSIVDDLRKDLYKETDSLREKLTEFLNDVLLKIPSNYNNNK